MPEIEITPALLADLKQKAEAAENEHPSPWACEREGSDLADDCVSNFGSILARCVDAETQAHMAAADPATVLALVAEIERLRAMERRWHKLLANAQPGPECIGQGFEVKMIVKEGEAAGE